MLLAKDGRDNTEFCPQHTTNISTQAAPHSGGKARGRHHEGRVLYQANRLLGNMFSASYERSVPAASLKPLERHEADRVAAAFR